MSIYISQACGHLLDRPIRAGDGRYQPTTPQTRRRRVVIVDDDRDILEIISVNLEAEGIVALTASNARDAEQLIMDTNPDAVVLDVMMRGRDGLELLAALKRDESTRAIPVTLLTAKASDAEILHGWQAGADYYLTKPFRLEQLLYWLGLVMPQEPSERP